MSEYRKVTISERCGQSAGNLVIEKWQVPRKGGNYGCESHYSTQKEWQKKEGTEHPQKVGIFRLYTTASSKALQCSRGNRLWVLSQTPQTCERVKVARGDEDIPATFQ